MNADQLLELEARRRIVDFLKANPGMHLRALAAALEIPVSTVEYHCYVLARQNVLEMRDSGKFKAFYPANAPLDPRDKDILYVVRHEVPKRVCAQILDNPGCTPADLKRTTALSGPSVSYHLKRLRLAGLVREVPDGHSKHIFVEDPARVARLMAAYCGWTPREPVRLAAPIEAKPTPTTTASHAGPTVHEELGWHVPAT